MQKIIRLSKVILMGMILVIVMEMNALTILLVIYRQLKNPENLLKIILPKLLTASYITLLVMKNSQKHHKI